MLTADQRKQMSTWVREILGPEKAELWWKAKNPMLGNATPWMMCLEARREVKLYHFIEDAYENNRAAINGDEQRG